MTGLVAGRAGGTRPAGAGGKQRTDSTHIVAALRELNRLELAEALRAARAQQQTEGWNKDYALRAGVEGTVRQATDRTGTRRARYRTLTKTHLDHTTSAVALNMIRLDAWWNGHPRDRTRTSHLT